MDSHVRLIAVVLAGLLFTGCGEREAPSHAATSAKGTAAEASPELATLKAENTKLKAEAAALRLQVEELKLTPQVLLARVTAALAADRGADARRDSQALDQRFADSAQAKAAKAALARYDEAVAAREAQAKALEARGFYALAAQRAPTLEGVTLRVEALELGSRWQFDFHGDEWHYRDAERGEKFVLLRTTIQSENKSPALPDIGIYRIDGRKMTRVAQVLYEFRRWSSYGTFIGLHHDFKNDFSHTSAIPFNAAASISDDQAKQPFAVVATGHLCHRRGDRIGRPEVVYVLRNDCSSKEELNTEDFAKGDYRVLAFFNRPKGV